jgi:hypothetical protein
MLSPRTIPATGIASTAPARVTLRGHRSDWG